MRNNRTTYKQPKISFEAIRYPRVQHFYSLNCDQLWRPSCTSPKIRNPRFLYYGIDRSVIKYNKWNVIQWFCELKFGCFNCVILTKNDRLLCDAKLACHKLKLPSPSAIPNLLPCCEKRHRVTLANVPGGRGVQTTCWCPHSHICTEPSWPPVRYNGISGWAHIRFILSTLCFSTFWGKGKIQSD